MSKDAAENRLEDWDDVFVDIFNNLVLDGQQIIKEEELVSLPTRAYMRKNVGAIRSGMRDIRKGSRKNGILRLISLIENQTEIDNTMPERVMGYEYASYEEQIKQIMDENTMRKKSAGARRIFAKQKLSPVVTGVLYYGEKRWKHPRRLYEMIRFPEGIEERLKPYVADYPMNLVQVAHLTKDERERLTSDFRIIAEYLACRNDRESWMKFQNSKYEIRHIEEVTDLLWELSGEEVYLNFKNQIKTDNVKRKGKWTMCEMTRELVRVSREEGRDIGIRAMIQDNLDMGNEKETIVQKIIRYFSVTETYANNCYNQVVSG